MIKFNSRQSGLSLIETLVYVTIFALLFALIAGVLVSLSRSLKETSRLRTMSVSGGLAMERMVREIRSADTVDVASLFETNPGDLRLIDTDSDGAVRAVRFYVNEGKIYISENGEAGVALSPDSVTISSLIFYNLSNLNSQAVRIKLEVEKNQNNRITTLPFSDTVILRGSYQ